MTPTLKRRTFHLHGRVMCIEWYVLIFFTRNRIRTCRVCSGYRHVLRGQGRWSVDNRRHFDGVAGNVRPGAATASKLQRSWWTAKDRSSNSVVWARVLGQGNNDAQFADPGDYLITATRPQTFPRTERPAQFAGGCGRATGVISQRCRAE